MSKFALAFLWWLAAMPWAGAQDAKPMRIGVLLTGSSTQWSPFEDALVEGLRERGYIEGRNLVVVRRYGELSEQRIRTAAADLGAMQLDAIVTSCTLTTRSAATAAPSTPIIMASRPDPVGSGLVQSLGRPGGNVTGRSSASNALIGKRLEYLREVLPAAKRDGARIAVMMNGGDASHRAALDEALTAAKALNLAIATVDTSRGVDAALEALAQAGSQGLLIFADHPALIEHRARVADAAIRLKLPAISTARYYTDAGLLMAYGMDMRDDYKLSAAYLLKVRQRQKPADIPVELPTSPELVINLKTAAALGIVVPRELRLQAHYVIE
jgi:putative ABC transport system substrate-binding protein